MRPLPTALLLALAACNTGFEPQYRVTDLRVLSLHAEVEGSSVADATPGDTVVLEALVANPLGRAPVTVTWYGCAPPPDESLPPCADPEFLRDPARLASDPRVLPLGTGEVVSIPIPDVAAALGFVIDVALEEPAFQCRLYAEMPVVALVEADGIRALALKRVRLTPRTEDLQAVAPSLVGAYVRNENPAVLEILRAPSEPDPCLGGTAVAATPFPAGETIVCALASSDSAQRYNECGPDGTREQVGEGLSWQWYVTGGEFPESDGIGNATGNSLDFIPPAGPFTVWTIVRDGRGGEGWARRDVQAAQ